SVERGLVVLNYRVVAERKKDPGRPAVVYVAVLNADVIGVPEIAAVARRAGELKSFNNPVADDGVEVLDLDQAGVPVSRTEGIDEDRRSGVFFESAHGGSSPGSSNSTSGVASGANENCVARIYRIHRVLKSAPWLR